MREAEGEVFRGFIQDPFGGGVALLRAKAAVSKLKSENPDAATLRRYEDQLYSLLTQRPQQMITDVASTTGRDAPASEWVEAQRMLTWASELRPSDKSLAARATSATTVPSTQ